MRKLFLIIAIAFTANTASAQWWSSNEKVTGNKEVTTQTRNTPGYDRITVTGLMEVQLVAGKEGNIEIEGESNLLEYIETEVTGNQLKIGVKKGVNLQPSRNYPVKITVPYEDIDAVALTGSGHIRNAGVIKSRDFRVSITGSGNMNLNLETESLEGNVTGSGNIKLRGTARELTCKVTGSGDFLAYDLNADSVRATVTGSGDVEVSVETNLEARISGSGDITYQGSPAKQNFKTSGSGSVSKR